MRISDWSSDVCSSDLPLLAAGRRGLGLEPRLNRRILRIEMREVGDKVLDHVHRRQRGDRDVALQILARGGAGVAVLAVDRKSVMQGKSVSVRVDFGGRGTFKTQTLRTLTRSERYCYKD